MTNRSDCGMRVAAVLNRDSGTLATSDLDMLIEHIKREFVSAGYQIECQAIPGVHFQSAIEDAARADVVLAGGGDGSISTAAAICWERGKVLAILPAGTMNLVARTLKIPLDIFQAVTAVSRGIIVPCDIATANGRPFVHHFSVGLQPGVVSERNTLEYRSRWGKLIASLRALAARISRPPSVSVVSETEQERRRERVSVLTVSNNPFGPGHLPYADRLDQGLLGLYRAPVMGAGKNLKLATDLVAGTWESNPDFLQSACRKLELEFPSMRKNQQALIDGELVPLERHVSIAIHPASLQVLAP